LPLFIELFLLGPAIWSRSLAMSSGWGGTLRQAQHWEQQCQRQE